MSSLVSIIIPTFNRAHLLGETLDSVLAQTYGNWECIVVDDGSTDNTAALMTNYVAKDARFQYHYRPKDRLPGGNAARNYGFELSKGEFVQWFDSDDIMLEDYLKSRLEVIKKDTDVVFCAYTYFNENGLQNRVSNNIFSGNIIEDLINSKLSFSPLSYLIKKEILTDCRFDEELKQAQDADFFFKLFTSRNDLRILHISEVLYYVRKHNKSIGSIDNRSGLKLNSRFIVNKRFLRYFHEIGHVKATSKYKSQCLIDLKRLLDNKNYKLVITNIINFPYLNFKQKLYLIGCVLSEFIVGRGSNQFKKLNFKDG